MRKPTDELLAQVLPINNSYDIYVENKMKQSKENEWLKVVLNKVTLTPVYNYELILK